MAFHAPVLAVSMLSLVLSGVAGAAGADEDGPPMAASPPAPEAILANLQREHPRLLLGDTRLQELKRLAGADAQFAALAAELYAQADKLVGARALERTLTGPRLLAVSRDCLHRVLTLGLAWRLTGRSAYFDAARANLLAVCAFADWNPAHFLDVAEMSNAVGIGYDWLHPALSGGDRQTIRTALIRLGLEEGIRAEGGWDGRGKRSSWVESEFNWNQVCHGGLSVGALAVAESDPRYAQTLVANACRFLPRALRSYDPDGAWPEGPAYWAYASDYTVYALACLESALGTTFGLDRQRGLARTGLYPLSVSGPTGLMPNFADAGDSTRFSGTPLLFWFGSHYHLDGLVDSELGFLKAGKRVAPLDLVWYAPGTGAAPALPRERAFGGKVALAVMRSAWGDPDALYAYLKAGYNQVNHGHLDLGSFECDCLGERWVRDLGSDDYNLPGYFSGGPKGPRWRYYRLNSHSHSVPLIDGADQLVSASATLVLAPDDGHARAVVDLSSAYAPAASRAARGIALIESRSALLVQDEFELTAHADISWAITTDAEIGLAGATAILTLHGKRMQATILAPPDAVFTAEDAQQPPPQKSNQGVHRLLVAITGASGTVRIAVRLAPAPPPAAPAALVPLAQW